MASAVGPLGSCRKWRPAPLRSRFGRGSFPGNPICVRRFRTAICTHVKQRQGTKSLAAFSVIFGAHTARKKVCETLAIFAPLREIGACAICAHCRSRQGTESLAAFSVISREHTSRKNFERPWRSLRLCEIGAVQSALIVSRGREPNLSQSRKDRQGLAKLFRSPRLCQPASGR